MPRKFEEGDILFGDVVQDADGVCSCAGEPDDAPAGAAQVVLQRLHAQSGRAKVLHKEFFERIHGRVPKRPHQY